ncbi:golgi uridine diphosphate-N-acetylglucosamine transporter [Rhizina undulata]
MAVSERLSSRERDGPVNDAPANTEAEKTTETVVAIAQTTIPVWVQTGVMVFTLEAIVKSQPTSGHLITFTQFLLVALEGLIHHFSPSSPTLLKPLTIPLHRWLIQVTLFFSVSILNNLAFSYNISVPVHIILRSGGSMTTMLVGFLWGKKYSRNQVLSVVVLTGGIILSAMADAGAKKFGGAGGSGGMGLVVLGVAQVLSAFMGLYIEATYKIYGNNYREGLFYTHALSLIFFIPLLTSIRDQFTALLSSPPLPVPAPLIPLLPHRIQNVPREVVYLLLNAITQYVCIRGVNILGSISSALTVTIVLNIRKLVSLLLSIWLFGNELGKGVLLGAAVVFGGGFLYGIESQRLKAKARGKKTQ